MSRHVILTDCWVIHLSNRIQVYASCIILREQNGLILVCHLHIYWSLKWITISNSCAIRYALRWIKRILGNFVALFGLMYLNVCCLRSLRESILLINWAAVWASKAFQDWFVRFGLELCIHLFRWRVYSTGAAWIFSLYTSDSGIEEEILATHHARFRCECTWIHALCNWHRSMIVEEVVLSLWNYKICWMFGWLRMRELLGHCYSILRLVWLLKINSMLI